MLLPGAPRLAVIVLVAFAETPVLLADGGKTTGLAALVDRVDDPVDAGIAADSLVVGVHQDDLVVLVHTVLVHPVRVEHPQVTTPSTDTLLRRASQSTLVLQLVHTLVDGLSEGGTLVDGLFPSTPTNTDTVHDVTLLGLVTEAASLVGAGWAGGTVDDVQLTELPAPNTEQESEDIRLFFLVQLANVLVCAHFWCVSVL